MFEGSSDFLAYALVLFLGWVYLPYTFFKFSAEIFVDLGRRRDSTPLEEIISAFLPSVLLNLQALIIFKICSIHNDANFSIDFAVMAAMFGNRQGSVSVSDYIYAGNWWGPALYLGFLWALAISHGIGFGIVTRRIAETKGIALHGMEPVTMAQVKKNCRFPAIVRYIWFVWFAFFRESFVPLFTWRAKALRVRVELKDKTVYIGKLAGYEKTTEGKLEAVRLSMAKRYREQNGNGLLQESPMNHPELIDTEDYLVLWSEVVELRLVRKATTDKEDVPPHPSTGTGSQQLPSLTDQPSGAGARLVNQSVLLVVLSLVLTVSCNPTFESDEQREARCRESTLDDTPDTAARTIRQRVNLPADSAIELGFDSIEQLQAATDRRHVLQGIALPRREKVQREFTVRDFYGKPVKVHEGNTVSIRGYIVGIPHVSRADRDPCDTTPGRAGRDYVLNLGELAGDTEFDSIVAVIAAKYRHKHPDDAKWDLENIRREARDSDKTMFRLTGQLFYNSKHVANNDPANELKDEPRRISLWELHPVTNIEVCRKRLESTCRDPRATFDSIEDASK